MTMAGLKHSEEAKKKMSVIRVGKKHTVESLKKMSLSQTGHPGYMKGVKFSEEHKARISESLRGKKLTEERKNKIRISSIGKKVSLETRKKLSDARKGKRPSEETIRKSSESRTGGKRSEESKKRMSESALARVDRHTIFKDTKPELKVEFELARLGIYFEKQRSLCKIARVDFYLPEIHVVIQVDGCYWHDCPIHCPNGCKGRTTKDVAQDAVLASNGFNVYRIWEHDIMTKDFDLSNFVKLI